MFIVYSGYQTRYPLVAAATGGYRADDAHRAALEYVGIDHCGVQIRVPHELLNGSDILSTLQ